MSRPISDRQIQRQPLIVAKQLQKMKPNPNFTIAPKHPDAYDVFYILLHPQGGHYKNQKHVLEFKTVYGSGSDKYYFPFQPPNVKFLTAIYHTNISTEGTICLDILKDKAKWSAQYTMETVIISIIALLDDPNTSSPYNTEPSKQWTQCNNAYNQFIGDRKNLNGNQLLAMKEKIFTDYDLAADHYASKNNLMTWAQYFPSLLDINQIDLDEKKESDPDIMPSVLEGSHTGVNETHEEPNDLTSLPKSVK